MSDKKPVVINKDFVVVGKDKYADKTIGTSNRQIILDWQIFQKESKAAVNNLQGVTNKIMQEDELDALTAKIFELMEKGIEPQRIDFNIDAETWEFLMENYSLSKKGQTYVFDGPSN